jgi:hypothetical protein
MAIASGAPNRFPWNRLATAFGCTSVTQRKRAFSTSVSSTRMAEADGVGCFVVTHFWGEGRVGSKSDGTRLSPTLSNGRSLLLSPAPRLRQQKHNHRPTPCGTGTWTAEGPTASTSDRRGIGLTSHVYTAFLDGRSHTSCPRPASRSVTRRCRYLTVTFDDDQPFTPGSMLTSTFLNR